MLELSEVVKHYHDAGEEVRAVDGITLQIEPGEMVALLGPSGSGKTTVLLLAAALLRAEAGSVTYRGRNLMALSERETNQYLLRDVGFVFQQNNLMPRVSAVENAARKLIVAGVRMREARERATEWLHRVGMGHRLDYPAELLSAGERQRVAIARALAGEPGLILADEPTGSLDSTRSRQIVELLHSIAREREASVLLVTHDEAAAGIADKQCSLSDGQLTEFAPPLRH